jgi:hypothetical protein
VTEVLRDASNRDALGRGVGTPHLRHRLSAAGLFRREQFPHRGAHSNQVGQLIGTPWRGYLTFEAPMLFPVGFPGSP